jgi:cell wall-associated NlpC family hydrolase
MAEKKKDEVDRYLIVTEPIADLRRKPLDPARGDYEYDDLQETQLLLNEVLLYRGENDEWYQLEAIEQSDFTPEALWRGYPGWVRKRAVREVKKVKRNTIVIKGKNAYVYTEPDQASKTIMTVSMGTRFHATGKIMGGFCQVSLPKGGNGWVVKRNTRDMARKIDEKQLRRRIVNTAMLFLGVPYLWGGRSIKTEVRGQRSEVRGQRSEVRRKSKLETRNPQPDVVRGVDCSGLTNLVFRANNIDVPRNAHVQWMVTPKITQEATQPGDLIFVSNQDEFYKISHVMISLGGEKFIEALETGTIVKINSFRDKFGKTLVELAKQDLISENKKIYCGKMPVSK